MPIGIQQQNYYPNNVNRYYSSMNSTGLQWDYNPILNKHQISDCFNPQQHFNSCPSTLNIASQMSAGSNKEKKEHTFAMLFGLASGSILTAIVQPKSIKLLPFSLLGTALGYFGYNFFKDSGH